MFKDLNKPLCCLMLGLSLMAAPLMAQAVPVTATTGDLGNNIVSDAGIFEALLNLSNPSNSSPASLDVKYGLWTSPSVLVSVAINGNALGNLNADLGYLSPGPSFTSFDVTGLLLNGLNTIRFDGLSASDGDYVIGQVDINFESGNTSIPEPATLALLGMGILGMGLAGRRRRPH